MRRFSDAIPCGAGRGHLLASARARSRSPTNSTSSSKAGSARPGQKLRARRDIGIRNAVIAALEPEIPMRARSRCSMQGKLVSPA